MSTLGVDYIGKYSLLEARILKDGRRIETPVLHTDNCREVVWYANMDPEHNTPVNVCGERDFYKVDNKWHSFEL